MREDEIAALQAAGLYDPALPRAAERLALIEWLASRGATIEQMVSAKNARALTALGGDLALRSGERLTLSAAASLVGMKPERMEQISLAVGLPPVNRDAAVFSPEDAHAFAAFEDAARLFGEEATLHFMRVVGSSLGRMAEACVSLFLVNIEGPIVQRGGDELALAKANVRVIEAFHGIPKILSGLLRAHLETAIRRMRNARHEHSLDLVRMTVGFVDLVGFTSLSRQLSVRELADVIARFESVAHDLVTARDGRLVKLIGDEVMFVALDAAAACDVAFTLVERFADNPSVTPRGGLALGPLLMRSGDYYGPIVNLASRVADTAVPHEVLVTADVAESARGGRLSFEPAGKRMLKGFDEPVALFSAVRP